MSTLNKINVFITVDTEHSIGGSFENRKLKPVGNDKRIYGRFNGRQYALPLIMDIADRYGIFLTFFVEVLNKYYFDEEETKQVCEYILQYGHDPQLHLHPNWLNFKMDDPGALHFKDDMFSYSLKEQSELVAEGKELLTRYTGKEPVAFRAGNYAADENTLVALKINGFHIDSSYNHAFSESRVIAHKPMINDVAMINGIWEFPVTNFRDFGGLKCRRTKPLDINGVSFGEMKNVLEAASTSGPFNVTIVLHSFTFIKAFDLQYDKVKPRYHLIRRFTKLCKFLMENRDRFHVRTFGSLDTKELTQIKSKSVHAFPKVSPVLSASRTFQQVRDRFC